MLLVVDAEVVDIVVVVVVDVKIKWFLLLFWMKCLVVVADFEVVVVVELCDIQLLHNL